MSRLFKEKKLTTFLEDKIEDDYGFDGGMNPGTNHEMHKP